LRILQLDTAGVTRIHLGPEPADEEGFTAPRQGQNSCVAIGSA